MRPLPPLRPRSPGHNQRGFTLTEVLIAAGIMAVLGTAAIHLILSQQRSAIAIEQKQDLIGLRSTLIQQMANPAVCNWQMINSRFDATSITAAGGNSVSFRLRDNTVYSGDSANRSVLAAEGQPLSPASNSPRIRNIRVANLKKAGEDHYIGELLLTADPNSTIIGFQDVAVPIVLRTDPASPLSNKRVTRCGNMTVSLYPDWPDIISCGDTVWHIRSPGQYNCFRGGEVTTRSAILTFDPVSRRPASYSNRTDTSNRCQCGSCCSQSMDDLIRDGLTR